MHRGHEGVREAFQAYSDTMASCRYEFSEFRDLGDRVVAIGRLRTAGGRAASRPSPRSPTSCDFKDGKVIRPHSFQDADDPRPTPSPRRPPARLQRTDQPGRRPRSGQRETAANRRRRANARRRFAQSHAHLILDQACRALSALEPSLQPSLYEASPKPLGAISQCLAALYTRLASALASRPLPLIKIVGRTTHVGTLTRAGDGKEKGLFSVGWAVGDPAPLPPRSGTWRSGPRGSVAGRLNAWISGRRLRSRRRSPTAAASGPGSSGARRTDMAEIVMTFRCSRRSCADASADRLVPR